MQKLKTIIEMIGRHRKLNEELPKLGGITLKPGMKVKLKSYDEILKNHYYEQFPEKYKKLAVEIAGKTYKIKEVKPNGQVESNNILLNGLHMMIEVDDIQNIVKEKPIV